MNKEKAFTLVELLVVISIIAVLSGIILFSVTQYINKGKDSNISANLAVLIPAGEVYYNAEEASNGDGYNGFCTSTVAQTAKDQMPIKPNSQTVCGNTHGFCCTVDAENNQSWAACVQEFTDITKAYCVDSRGVKKDNIDYSYCSNQIGAGLVFKCP